MPNSEKDTTINLADQSEIKGVSTTDNTAKIENNQIYCGDSYELIKLIPDKSIDLVIIDPPYEFVEGGQGHSPVAQRMAKTKIEIYDLDTKNTKKKIYQSGGGCFGTKKRAYHSQLAETDVSRARQKYLNYVSEHGKDEEAERLRVIANTIDSKQNTSFISHGFDNSILDELCRVMKKINIYVWCNKNQLRQLIDYFDDKGCFIDLLTWNKTNPIPTCNNKYLSDIEYCVFAREEGVKLYGDIKTKSKWFTSQCNVADKKEYDHPSIKPLERIKHFVINSTNPELRGGDVDKRPVVFDCFLGSGTTCVAAKELGCNYIGIELNPKFYQIAKDRLNGINQKNEMSLFDTDFDKVQEEYEKERELKLDL